MLIRLCTVVPRDCVGCAVIGGGFNCTATGDIRTKWPEMEQRMPRSLEARLLDSAFGDMVELHHGGDTRVRLVEGRLVQSARIDRLVTNMPAVGILDSRLVMTTRRLVSAITALLSRLFMPPLRPIHSDDAAMVDQVAGAHPGSCRLASWRLVADGLLLALGPPQGDVA